MQDHQASAPTTLQPTPPAGLDRGTVVAAFVLGTAASGGFTLLPVTLPALSSAFALTPGQVGLVGTLELIGVTAGAFTAGLVGRRLPTRPLAIGIMTTLFVCALATMLVHSIVVLAAMRMIFGSMAGFALSLAYSVLSKTRQPDRSFALLSVFPLIYGALGFPLVHGLEAATGWYAPFLVLAVTAGAALIASFWLNGRLHQDSADLSFADSLPNLCGVLALASVVLYYAGVCAIYAFAFTIGNQMTGSADMTGAALSASQVVGIAGCLLAVYLAGRVARKSCVIGGFAITLAGMALMMTVHGTASYFIGLMAVDFAWNFLAGSHIAAVGDMDDRGSAAAFLAVAINGGAALGPLLGYTVVHDNFLPLQGAALALIGFALVIILIALDRRQHMTGARQTEDALPASVI